MILFFRETLGRYPIQFTLNIVLLLLSSLSGIASIISIVPLVDFFLHSNLEGGGEVTQQIISLIERVHLPVSKITFLLFFLCALLLKNGTLIASRWCMLRMKYTISEDIILGTFQHFFQARWSFFANNKQGTLINTFSREAQVVGDALGAISLLFSNCFQLAFYMIVPLYISWQITLISISMAFVFAFPLLLLSKTGYKLGKMNTLTANESSNVTQESLSTAKIILGFGQQNKSVKNMRTAYKAHVNVTLKSQILSIATPLIYEPFGMLVVVIALVVGQKYTLQFSELAALLWALRSSVPLVGDIVTRRNSLKSFLPSYEQITQLRKLASEQVQKSGDIPFLDFKKEIKIEGISFSYSGDSSVLSDVRLRIPKGKMVAIIGGSGAGKSTLIDVIMGFNRPQSGKVTIDDIPLDSFEITSYRRRLGYVPQDSILFNMTIRENLRWASEDATDAETEEACRQANADEFIQEFPDGYETLVGDRGVRLSGGQRQRVALARAILRRPALLILDEATSSLDSSSEQLIQEAIDDIASKTTVVVIAHRLSTIVNADYVYVLDKGRVIEEGAYRELLNEDSHLSKMAQLQSMKMD
jgi:ABC-type multidrug transport system fused ATPase/permease subunit